MAKVQQLFEKIVHLKNRASLARAITLVESLHPQKRDVAQELLEKVVRHLDTKTNSFRIGISGPPGAGKSTFLESLGKLLLKKGHRIAILAVDPSSKRTGGSLLGDKTRMPTLAVDSRVFIRPSPSGLALGGVTKTMRESMILCEAAGFNMIFVETVGVGQSETAVADMVDLFCLILSPAAGDELQGLKRGVIEMCDLIVVNKADGDLKAAAMRTQADYMSAVKLLGGRRHRIQADGRPLWRPRVIRTSCKTDEGIEDCWDLMQEYLCLFKDSGEMQRERAEQRVTAMWKHAVEKLEESFRKDASVRNCVLQIRDRVASGEMDPMSAADLMLKKFLSRPNT